MLKSTRGQSLGKQQVEALFKQEVEEVQEVESLSKQEVEEIQEVETLISTRCRRGRPSLKQPLNGETAVRAVPTGLGRDV